MPGPRATSISPISGSVEDGRAGTRRWRVAPSSHVGNARHGARGCSQRLSKRSNPLPSGPVRSKSICVGLRELERLHVAAHRHHVVAPERLEQQVEPARRHPDVVVGRRRRSRPSAARKPGVAGVGQAAPGLARRSARPGRRSHDRSREPGRRVVVDDDDLDVGAGSSMADDAVEAGGEVVRTVERGDDDRRPSSGAAGGAAGGGRDARDQDAAAGSASSRTAAADRRRRSARAEPPTPTVEWPVGAHLERRRAAGQPSWVTSDRGVRRRHRRWAGSIGPARSTVEHRRSRSVRTAAPQPPGARRRPVDVPATAGTSAGHGGGGHPGTPRRAATADGHPVRDEHGLGEATRPAVSGVPAAGPVRTSAGRRPSPLAGRGHHRHAAPLPRSWPASSSSVAPVAVEHDRRRLVADAAPRREGAVEQLEVAATARRRADVERRVEATDALERRSGGTAMLAPVPHSPHRAATRRHRRHAATHRRREPAAEAAERSNSCWAGVSSSQRQHQPGQPSPRSGSSSNARAIAHVQPRDRRRRRRR